MSKENEALLIIDYTNDFVDDQGALSTKKAGQVLDAEIVKMAEDALSNGGWVVFPTDVHVKNDPYHPETQLFPPHNEAGSWGRQLYGQVADWYEQHQNDDHVLMLDKTRYSSFAGTKLNLWLTERNIKTVNLTGVCTDICVLHTAVDAYNLGYQIKVNKNAVGTFTEHGQEWALEHFKSAMNAEIL